MIHTMTFIGEYELDREFSPEEESLVVEETLDMLKASAQIKHAKVDNLRYTWSKHDHGGRIVLSVDVQFNLIGRILKKIGVIRQ